MNRLNVLIEGWRGVNHSYALVNQHQIADFLTYDDLQLFHVDVPFARPQWSRTNNPAGFSPDLQCAIDAIPAPGIEAIDCVYTIRSPFKYTDYRPARRTVTFMITEDGLSEEHFTDRQPRLDAFTDSADLIQTSSRWSRDRIVDYGFPHDRIAVVPLGVEAELFAPLTADERKLSRTTLGIKDDEVAFFAICAPFATKGLDLLLRAFAVLVSRGRKVRLIVKDQKDVYGRSAEDMMQALSPRYPGLFMPAAIDRMSFVHGNVNKSILRLFYCTADCVVSPYRAEGFNLPVLEAISCGTPVIVTGGGASDDFVSDDVALRVSGTVKIFDKNSYIEPTFDHLVEAMDLFAQKQSPFGHRHLDACRTIARRYSWSSTSRAVYQLLRDGIPAT